MQYINTGMTLDRDGTPYDVVVPLRKIMDTQHINLLRFLNADIQGVEERTMGYIKDISNGARYEVQDSLYRGFSVLHPYFSLNEANISAFLNRSFACLISASWTQEKKKEEMMTALYASRGLDAECAVHYWLYDDPQKFTTDEDIKISPLHWLKVLQKEIKMAAVLLLDNSTSALAGTSPYKRSALYGAVSSDGFGGPSDGFIRLGNMAFTYGSVQGTDARTLSAQLDFADEGDILTIDGLLADTESFMDNPSAETPSLSAALSCLGDNGRIRMDEILLPTSLENLLQYEIKEMFAAGMTLKRDSTGKFIIPKDSTGAQTKTESLEQSLQREYRKAYKTHHRRVAMGILTKDQLGTWVGEAKEMQRKVLDGEITLNEFVMWLKM